MNNYEKYQAERIDDFVEKIRTENLKNVYSDEFYDQIEVYELDHKCKFLYN